MVCSLFPGVCTRNLNTAIALLFEQRLLQLEESWRASEEAGEELGFVFALAALSMMTSH